MVRAVLEADGGNGQSAVALLQLGGDALGDALAAARRAVRHDPSDRLATVALALALLNQGEHDEAERVLDAAGDFGDHAMRASLCRMSIARRRGDRAAAERWARTAVALAPFNPDLLVRVANALDPFFGAHHAGTRWLPARLAIWKVKSRFTTAPTLAAQSELLVSALAAEPQSANAREALRTMSTIGERRPAPYLALIAGMVAVAGFVALALLPARWSALATAAVALLGALHVRAYLAQRRALSPTARDWLAYVRRIHAIHQAQQRAANANRPAPAATFPAPPANTVFSVPSRCACDSLNFAFGETAIAYARMHLVEVRTHGSQLFEMSCPATLTPWLVFEASGSNGDHRPVRLCRIDAVPDVPEMVDDLPGQYL